MRRFCISLVLLFSLCFYIIISNDISFAFTWDDAKTYMDELRNNFSVPGDIRTGCNYILNNINTFETRVAAQGINLSSYSYFNFQYNGSYPKSIIIDCYNNGGGGTFTNNSSNFTITHESGKSFNFYNLNSGGYTIQQVSNLSNQQRVYNTSNRFSTVWGLTYEGFNYNNTWFNQYSPKPKLVFTPSYNNVVNMGNYSNVNNINGDRDEQVWLIGSLTGYNEYTKGYIEKLTGEVNGSSTYKQIYDGLFIQPGTGDVYVYNSNILFYNIYRVYFVDEEYNYTDMYGFYFLPLGKTYKSGDTFIYGVNDNDLQPILEQNQKNQTFWENTYNSLFSMSSGDVNEVYLMVESYFPSGDTPLSVYDTIFGAYGNEPDDFIIRWDDHPLNITWFNGQTLYSGDFIKSGYMNFSKECRDNDVLSNIKFWFNTLFTIFIFIAYYKFLYKCFCDMLGVVSEDIHEDEPEHRPIGFGRGDK